MTKDYIYINIIFVHYLNTGKIEQSIKKQGYGSLGDFAKAIGIHRNTLHYYLTEKPLIPDKLELILKTLNLPLNDVVLRKKDEDPAAKIAPLIDQMSAVFPGYTWALFGSRASGKNKKYSDWDMGVFFKDLIPVADFRKMLLMKDDLQEDFAYFVDLTDLSRAESWFLKSIADQLCFLTGSREGWSQLLRRIESAKAENQYG